MRKECTPSETPKRYCSAGQRITENRKKLNERGYRVLPECRMSLTGFTLIELMIVVAIIAVIAAIAIPSLIKTKSAANENAAAATLKTFNSMMATYKQKNYHGWGCRYPWAVGPETNSGKYCGLYYEVNNAGERVVLIAQADAAADAGCKRIDPNEGDLVTYVPVIKTGAARVYLPPVTFRLNPKQGYWFGLVQTNKEGFTYNRQNAKNQFAIMAAPEEYGQTGETTFIMNELGTVYGKDFGNSGWRQYPGPDPNLHGWEINE